MFLESARWNPTLTTPSTSYCTRSRPIPSRRTGWNLPLGGGLKGGRSPSRRKHPRSNGQDIYSEDSSCSLLRTLGSQSLNRRSRTRSSSTSMVFSSGSRSPGTRRKDQETSDHRRKEKTMSWGRETRSRTPTKRRRLRARSRGLSSRSWSLEERSRGLRDRSRTSNLMSRERTRERGPGRGTRSRTLNNRRRELGPRSRGSRNRSWSLEERSRGSRSCSLEESCSDQRDRSRISDHRRMRVRSRTQEIRSRKRRRPRRRRELNRSSSSVKSPQPRRRVGHGTRQMFSKEAADDKMRRLKRAMEAVQRKGVSKAQAARDYDLPRSTLFDFMKAPNKTFRVSRGQNSKLFSREAVKEIELYAERQKKMGCGLNFDQLQTLMQEILLRQKAADPTFVTGLEDSHQLPPKPYVYGWVRRSRLVVRSGRELSLSRAAVTPESIAAWFRDLEEHVLSMPGVAEAFQNPRQLFSLVRSPSPRYGL